MKRSVFFLLVVVALVFCSCGRQGTTYEWNSSYNGGGGYIIALYQDPACSDVLYSRCDVAGIFKSTDGAKTWFNINNGCTLYHQHQVRSFAQSRQRPNVLFRCSGSLNDSTVYGDIMKSTDAGEHWRVVTSEPNFFGNGESKFYGDLIDVSPFNPDDVVSGSFSKGLYVSHDEGETWKSTGLEGHHFAVVNYHPFKEGYVLAGFRNHYTHESLLKKEGRILDGKGGVYLSRDGGETWQLMKEGTDLDVVQFAFDYSDSLTVYVMSSDAIYRTMDCGATLTKIAEGRKSLYGKGYSFVHTNPAVPGMILTSFSTPKADGMDTPDLPILYSTDKGDTWKYYKDYSLADFRNMPDYIQDLRKAAAGISKVMIDRTNPERWWFSNWYGVCRSDDAGMTWDGNDYRGLTTTCIENVVADPITPGKAFFTCADVVGFCTENYGETYYPVGRTVDQFIHNGTAFCPSSHRSGYIVSGITSWPKAFLGSAILVSEDGGRNIEIVKRLEPGQFVQAIKESRNEGEFFAFIDGDVAKGAGLLRSTDWGRSWESVTFPFPEDITVLPKRKEWVEFELLPITSYQQKNVCGCDALLATSPFDGNTLYIGEWTEGIFKSADSGKTWTDISANLPFHKDSIVTLVSLKCDESAPGTLYAGFVKEGLWRTADDGQSWQKVYPVKDEIFNASSVVVGGRTADELYVACEPLYWSPAASEIIYSSNRGKTWKKISDDRFGAIRWKGLAVDKTSGTVYAVSDGNGAFYGKPTK